METANEEAWQTIDCPLALQLSPLLTEQRLIDSAAEWGGAARGVFEVSNCNESVEIPAKRGGTDVEQAISFSFKRYAWGLEMTKDR